MVVRPGGRIAVFDGDYASLTFELDDADAVFSAARRCKLDGEIELMDVETQEQRRLWLTPRDRRRYEERYQLFLALSLALLLVSMLIPDRVSRRKMAQRRNVMMSEPV